jgi:hypothetical protein
LDGFSEPWSLAIACMAQPRIGSKAAKPECEIGAQDIHRPLAHQALVHQLGGAGVPEPVRILVVAAAHQPVADLGPMPAYY